MTRRRPQTQMPKPMNLAEFIKSKIVDLDAANIEMTLGTLENGTWQEYSRGETWNCIRLGSVWDEPKYITVESIEKEWEFYTEQFENRMEHVLGFI